MIKDGVDLAANIILAIYLTKTPHSNTKQTKTYHGKALNNPKSIAVTNLNFRNSGSSL